MKPGSVNLVFGRNEEGKTALVEFIIRALFRNTKSWNLRFDEGEGRVIVSGLSEEPVVFSPNGSVKLDNYWCGDEGGLPPDFARLLIVKGAETRLSQNRPVHPNDLKKFLSNRELLDTIESRISKSILKSTLENGRIVGPDQGEIKDRRLAIEEYEEIESLFTQLDRDYSGGRRRKWNDRARELTSAIHDQEEAKKYTAWMKEEERKKLQKEADAIDEVLLSRLRSDIHLYKENKRYLEEKQSLIENLRKKTHHLEWLRNAEVEYRELMQKKSPNTRTSFIFAGGVLMLLAAVLAYLDWTLPALIFAFGGGGFLILPFVLPRLRTRTNSESMEWRRLQESFFDRFDMTLHTLADMESKRTELESYAAESDLLETQQNAEQAKVEQLSAQIGRLFFDQTGKYIREDAWDETLSALQQQFNQLRSEIQTAELELERLQVDPSDYITQKTEIAYSRETFRKLESELKHVQTTLEEDEQKLDILKQRICVKTGDDISLPWEELIQHLKDVRDRLLESIHTKTADIIGKIAVSHVLNGLRQDEEAKIEEGLRSPAVLEPLKLVTGRYSDLRMEGDGIVVSDGFVDMNLDHLSTGAMEQVLLALRIGFARRWLAHESDSFFLILDDAFQYSDWIRRELLMRMVVNLAENGWQILYFTMDDHIRSLFRKAGKRFKDRFCEYGLSEED